MLSFKSIILFIVMLILFSCSDQEQAKAPLEYKINNNTKASISGARTTGKAVSSIVRSPVVMDRTDPYMAEIAKDLYVADPLKPKPMNGVGKQKYVGLENIQPVVSQGTGADRSIQTTITAANTATNIANTGGFLFIPADPHGAAGINHVVNVVNVTIEFYQLDGTQDSSQSLSSFFSALSPVNNTFDPKVIYDQYEDRFVVVTLEVVNEDNAATDSSRLLVAVSDDGNPNGTWYMTSIDMEEVIGSNSWMDYPGLAIDEEAIYVTANMFAFESTGSQSFTGNRLVIIDKGTTGGFYDNSSASVVKINPVPGGFSSSTQQPAHIFGTPSDANLGTFLVMFSGLTDATGPGLPGNEYVQVIQVDDPLGTPSISASYVNFGDVDDLSAGLADAPQSGTATLVEVNDRRTYNAVWRDDALYTGTTITANSGADSGETTALWIKVDTSGTPALDEVGTIGGEDIASGTYTFFPSIMVNSDGGIAVTFSASASSIFPGAYMTVKSPGDTAGSNRGSLTVAAGTDSYVRTFGGPLNRWGDYNSMSLDPNGECFWSFNKYAITSGNSTGAGDDGQWETTHAQFCNDAPKAQPDSITVNKGGTATVLDSTETSLMQNDTDGDSFDTQSVNVTPAVAPSNGTVTLATDGTFSYEHDGSNNLSDSFQYTVCDDGSPSKCDTGTVTVNVNDSTSYCYTGSPDAIPDDDVNGLVTTINVPGSATISDINVSVDVTHTYVGDLLFSLEKVSSGTTVTLMDRPGVPASTFGCEENNVDTVFDDSSANAVEDECSETSPAVGFNTTSNPEGSLASFNSEDQQGDWELTISDNSFVDTGSLNEWCLIITELVSATANDDTATVAEDSSNNQLNVLDNDTLNGAVVVSVTQPANGSVNIFNSGTDVTYTPDADYCNDGSPTDDFTYTLTGGSSASVEVSVTCLEDNPTAVNDDETVTEDSTNNTFTVLSNDTDPDAGVIEVRSITQPSNGTASFTSANVTYTPDPDYCYDGSNTDDFTYTLNGGSTGTVAVTVTCEDDNPDANDDLATVTEDTSNNIINVLANDTDIDGGTKEVASVTQPTNGTAAFTSAQVTYTPNSNYCNDGVTTDDFTYTVNGGDSATVSMTVTCVDDEPTAVNDDATVDEDSINNAISVLVNDTDPDGGDINIRDVTQPDNGLVSIDGSNVIYTPDGNYCNDGTPTDDFTYTLNGGSTGIVAMTVTCIDDNPTAFDDADTVDEDSGTSVVDVLTNDTDPDGGTKEVTAVTQPDNGTAGFTSTHVTYTPDSNYCNGGVTDDFTYTITGGDTATVSMSVTCVDDNPVAVDDFPTTLRNTTNNPVNVLGNDTDVDGGPKAVTGVTQPTNGSTSFSDSSVSYTPDTDYCNDGVTTDDFTYTINGGDTATVFMEVSCNDDPPVAVNDAASVDEDSINQFINVLSNDTDTDGGTKEVVAVTQPGDGLVTFDASGVYYTPNGNYCNDGVTTDDFSYTITAGSTASVFVTVNCVDDDPLAVADSETVSEDSTNNSLLVLANDMDIDDGLIQVESVTQPDNGSTSFTANSVIYTPDLNYCNDGVGTDDFSYTLNGGSSTSVSVAVTCVDDPPVAVEDDVTVDEDSGLSSFSVLDNDTDVDNGVMQVISVGPASNGSTSFNSNSVSYTPDADYCGSDSFNYTLNGGTFASVNVTVNCVNDEPDYVLESDAYVAVSDLPGPPSESVACQFDFGPDNEDGSQSVNDFIVAIDSDPNGVLNSVDVLNDGSLSATYSGNQGVATVSVTLQDNGGTDFSGDDSSAAQQIQIHVQDYIFRGVFDSELCQ